MCKPYRRRRTGNLNRERQNGIEDAFRTMSPAYLAPTFALGFVWHLMLFHVCYEQLAMCRKDTIIPFGFLSMLIQAFLFRLDLPIRFRCSATEACYLVDSSTQHSALYSRGVLRRSRSLQERNGIGPGLSGCRDRIHGRAMDALGSSSS